MSVSMAYRRGRADTKSPALGWALHMEHFCVAAGSKWRDYDFLQIKIIKSFRQEAFIRPRSSMCA